MKGFIVLLTVISLGALCLSASAQPTLPISSASDISLAQYDVRSSQYQTQKACYDECWRQYQRLLSHDR
jgi:hypothetical protein